MKNFLFGIFIGFSFFSVTFAADFGNIGARPAYPNPNQLHGKEWFVYDLKPGEVREDAIEIQNNQDHPEIIMVYPADSVPSTDGGFALKQKVETMNGVGKWINLSQNEVKLDPHQSVIIPFTITIPENENIDVGEHSGGILLQKVNENPENINGIQLFTRVGVRVYVTVPGQIIKKLDITQFNVQFDAKKENYITILTVKNSGNVSQNITAKIKITNLYSWLERVPFIKRLYESFPIENERKLQVLRGDSLTSKFEFKKPFWGKFKVEAQVFYDDETRSLIAEPVELMVLTDIFTPILLLLIGAFLTSILALLILKKSDEQKAIKKINASKAAKASENQ